MSHAEAGDKIRMLRHSLVCFTCGLLSFVPLFGFGFGIAALRISTLAAASERRYWNAARPYRLIGLAAAACGLIFWSFIATLVVWNIVQAVDL